MSRNVQTAAKRTQADYSSTRLVLLMLADHARKPDFHAWPKQETLAELCGLSARTIRSAIAELKDLGEISEVTPGRGRGRTTVFRIDILARDFEVIEPEDNRQHASGFGVGKSGSGGPAYEPEKPATDDPKTGNMLPLSIEEKEETVPSLPASESDGEDWIFAEKVEDAF